MVIMVRGRIQPVTTSLLSVGEDKRDLLHKGPQPGTETITSTQLGHRLDCLTHWTTAQRDPLRIIPEKVWDKTASALNLMTVFFISAPQE